MNAALCKQESHAWRSRETGSAGDITLDRSPLGVENGFHRIGSVWEVLEVHAAGFVHNTEALAFLREDMERRLRTAIETYDPVLTEITAQDRDNFAVLFENWSGWLKSHELDASLDCLKRLQEEYRQDEPQIREIIRHMKAIVETLEGELRRRVFLFVVSEDANLYRNPVASFPLAWAAYPSARRDIEEACRCYALGRYTACVFHSMAILQVGLYALAHKANVTLRYPVELAEWNEVLSAIERYAESLRNQPRSAARDERLTFFSECAAQFRYFKDAWRNHVAHMRESYDRDQAHSILLHVRDFMEKASTRVGETPSVQTWTGTESKAQ